MTVQSRKCQLSPALDFDSECMYGLRVSRTVRREDIYITQEKGLCTECPVFFMALYIKRVGTI
jgi:hypothetical protein